MKLRSLELFHLAVPLRDKIRHASHERTVSDNLIVKATLSSGHVGYGEGVPRTYVTGETIPSTFAALVKFDAGRAMGVNSSFEQAVERIALFTLPEIETDPRGMYGNAARSALEIALLDAYSRAFDRSVGDAIQLASEPGLKLSRTSHPVRYSGAITADSSRKERISAIKMRVYGFSQVKIKVGVANQDDARRMASLRRILGSRMDVRIDANESWNAEEVVEKVRPLLPFRPTALEQPIPHGQVNQLTDLRPNLGVPVMLDESLCGYPDAVAAIAHKTADILNVRISKCGGIFPSLRIMALAGRSGLSLQLGCHPGETGLLSAAGRHVATKVLGLRYVEGSYDRHVLGENVITEDITFGYGGRAKPLRGLGLGVTVDPDLLARICVEARAISYE